MMTRRAARAAAGAGGELSALPDHLLELCMPCTRDSTWPLSTLRLVCKRWKRVFDSSARLTPRRWFVQPARLLGRGQGASATAADGSALVRLAACRAGVVRDAFVEEAHKQWRLEAVQQLTSLACLTLRADGDEEYPCERPGQALAQQQLGLAALPRLCRLSLNAAGLLEPSCQQLAAAAHLTSLNLGTFLYDVPDGLWDALACMRSLVELQITVHATDETTTISSHAWRCLAACTQLSCLRLLDGSVCGGIDEEGIFELQAGITQLTALRNFALHGNIASLGDLWQHTGLTQLALMNSHIPFPEPPRGSASLPALRTAEVGSIWRELPLFWDGLLSSALRHVTRLVLHSFQSESDEEEEEETDDAAFEQMGSLVQLKKLHTLQLDGVLHSIPDTVQDLTSLKLLDVSNCKLRELPEGRYLLGLRTLLMPGHRMRRLPPALATARSLEVLDVMPDYKSGLPAEQQRAESTLLLLQPSDLSVLAAMPALRLLCLPLSHEMFEADNPGLRNAQGWQWLLSVAFSALLPHLVFMTDGAAQLPGVFRGAAFEGGLHPERLSQLQAWMESNWAALSDEGKQAAFAWLCRAAESNQLSPRAAALLAAFAPTPASPSS